MNPPRFQFFLRSLRLPLARAGAVALLLGLPAKVPAASGSTNATAPARSTANAPARVDFTTFKAVTDRNVFNANRTVRGAPPVAPRETRRPSRVDQFGLVGTMAYEKGPMAFFDGNNSDFRKAVKLEGTVAGWTLAAVSLQSVKLTEGTNSIELKVGHSLRREDDGVWQPAAGTDFASASSGGGDHGSSSRWSSRGSSSTTSSASAAPADDSAASEVLRKLMERRAKEEQ
jgi:hypothetical protein